jgi:hypothetical protein
MDFSPYLITLVACAAYTAYVLRLIVRGTRHTAAQKVAQALPLIVLPLFGAALVHAFLLLDAAPAGEDR